MLTPETQLGPYKIVAAIGAGGMGEVYRAVDTRLGREVALKVLSAHLTNDADATRRFEQEARAAGRLNHPNILSIYDIGEAGNRRFIVSELLEGESLRARIRQGPIPPRKAVEYAAQVARGLAAAHERGIIHRDLKPENLFLTRDGIVKILDFGLVKLMPRLFGPEGNEHDETLPGTPTEPGRILGTVGYMSPEQIRGGSGDHRSDLFAFGAILYEMLSGRPAFHADSPIETLNEILKGEPIEFADLGLRVPSALERVVRHCLEKNPDERFQSARDLAFDLGAMSGLTSQSVSFRSEPRFRPADFAKPALAVFALVVAVALAYAVGTRHGHRPPPSFKRLTFRSGTILNARFAPDGETIFYGARFAGMPPAVYSTRADSPESRDLGFGPAELLSVSSNGQLAILLRPRFIGYLRQSGTLARVPIAGGTPRELLEDVEAADWTPGGDGIAVVRTVNGRARLESPVGHVLYSTVGWISHPRFSPAGDRIAFIDHPFVNDDRGSVATIPARGGTKETLTQEWQSVEGIAWSPAGNEIWFAADQSPAGGRVIGAVTPGAAPRVLVADAGWLWIHDLAHDGRLLASHQSIRAGIIGLLPGETHERDLSWLDYSVVRDLSADGKTILFSESGEAGGSKFGVYTRTTDGSPAVRLSEGTSEALSPDGRQVLSIVRDKPPSQIVILPTGPGQPRAVTNDRLNHRNARWFPDGKTILFQANEPGRPPRLFVQPIAGSPRAISPENVSGVLVTPDGRRVLGRAADKKFYFFPVDGGTPEPVNVLQGNEVPIRFSADGKSIFVGSFGKIPAMLTRVDLATGQRLPWREAMPADPAGLINVGPIFVTPDGRTTVYSYTRLLSDLYLISPDR